MPAPESDRELLALLRRAIAARGVRLRSLSAELGWHGDYASQLLAGRIALRVDHLYALAKWLGEPVGKLVARVEGREVEPEIDYETLLRNRLAELVLASLRDLLHRWPQPPPAEDGDGDGEDTPRTPREE